MKTIDVSLDYKIKENDAKIQALIHLHTNPDQKKKNNFKIRKIPKEMNNHIHIEKNHKQKILPKTITTCDLGMLSTNPNTNSQSVSLTSLHTQIPRVSTMVKMKPRIVNNKLIKNNNTNLRYRNSKISTKSNKTLTAERKNLNTSQKNKKNNLKKINLNEMFERFKIDENKKKEKIEKMKQEKEEKENKICSYRPTIDVKTKHIMNKNKTDFLTRQTMLEEKKKKNEEKLKESISQSEQEKILNTSYLYQKKIKDSISKASLNISMLSDISNLTRSKKEINDRINRLLEWNQQKKEKISRKLTEKQITESKDHIPSINKRSSSLASKNTQLKVYERLSREDEVIKEKKRLLRDVLTPTFKPDLFLTKNYGKGVREKKEEKKDKDDELGLYKTKTKYQLTSIKEININNNKKSYSKKDKKFKKITNIENKKDKEIRKKLRDIVIKNISRRNLPYVTDKKINNSFNGE